MKVADLGLSEKAYRAVIIAAMIACGAIGVTIIALIIINYTMR